MSEPQAERAISKKDFIDFIKKDLDGREPDVSTAMLIAAYAFHGDNDRSGQSYVIHLLQTFASGTQSNNKVIVGLLHDLIEDKDWTLADLREIRFPEKIVYAIDCMTHREGELYFDSIERLGRSIDYGDPAEHPFMLAIDPKIADLTHNMDGSRSTGFPSERNLLKQNAYIVARNYLVALKRHEIEAGTPVAEFMRLKPALYSAELLHEFSAAARVAAGRSGASVIADAKLE